MMKQLILAAAPFVAGAVWMWKEAFHNEVKETMIEDERFKQKTPIGLFFISDIHRRLVDMKIIEQVKDRTSAVVIGGDLCERGVPKERVRENIRRLQQVAPVFFVPGNNDYEAKEAMLFSVFQEQEVTVLENCSALLAPNVYLLGTGDLSKGKADKTATFSGVRANAFKIVVSHNPAFLRLLTEQDNVALFLSGHTHGGQIRFGPFGPYEKGSWKKVKGACCLVSNGYGTTRLPLRLGARAETHFIRISGKQTKQLR